MTTDCTECGRPYPADDDSTGVPVDAFAERASKRSYGCSFGDGNPYDYILVDAQSGDTLFVCVPCFIRQAMDMVTAFLSADTPETQAILAMMEKAQGQPVPGPSGRKRGHNAPAGEHGEDLFDKYEDLVLADELPEEFR